MKGQEGFVVREVLDQLTRGGARGSVFADIDFCAGEGFGKAIRWCLDPADFIISAAADTEHEVDEDEYFEGSISLQEAVLASLQHGMAIDS
jgi:hypothetical protein